MSDTTADPEKITGSALPASWEKCTVWLLSNGWKAWEQYNTCYGPYLSSLESPDGKLWQASNGDPGDQYSIGGAEKANAIFKTDKYIDLPEFAKPWLTLIRPEYSTTDALVRPNFEKQFHERRSSNTSRK